MKNYADSDYALNRYSEGIVYRFADGIAEVTLAGYLAENPGKTEADFLELKEISDAIYLEQAREWNARTKNDLHFDDLGESLPCKSPSPEEILVGEVEAREENERRRARLAIVGKALGKLTQTQRRRYLMHHAGSLTTREIGAIEGVSHVAAVYSLEAATKKIKKFLANG